VRHTHINKSQFSEDDTIQIRHINLRSEVRSRRVASFSFFFFLASTETLVARYSRTTYNVVRSAGTIVDKNFGTIVKHDKNTKWEQQL